LIPIRRALRLPGSLRAQYVIEGHSAEGVVANSRHIVAAVEEEVAGMSRHTVVAAEGRRSFRTEAEVSWSNRRILAEVGCSASVALYSCWAGRKLASLVMVALAGIVRHFGRTMLVLGCDGC
ncbi:hypothetical protein KCU61_g713, partial [Aureobasidium melanogenum]